MAAVNYGIAYVHGLPGTITDAIVKSFSPKKMMAKTNNLEDEAGIVVERRGDDRTTEADITIAFDPTFSIPAAFDLITYNGVEYIILEVGEAYSAGEFAEISLSLITSEGIVLP